MGKKREEEAEPQGWSEWMYETASCHASSAEGLVSLWLEAGLKSSTKWQQDYWSKQWADKSGRAAIFGDFSGLFHQFLTRGHIALLVWEGWSSV